MPRAQAFKLLIVWFSLIFCTHTARAGSFYWEFGFGPSAIRKASAYFLTTPNSTPLGIGVNGTFIKNLSSDVGFFQAHVGLRSRYYSVATKEKTLNLVTPSLMLRFEIFHIYFGTGAGYYSWGSAGNSSGVFNLKSNTSFFYSGEAGAIWHIIPDFSVAIELGGDVLASQTKAIQGCVQMRFYLGTVDRESSSRKLDGWRYPFGISLF